MVSPDPSPAEPCACELLYYLSSSIARRFLEFNTFQFLYTSPHHLRQRLQPIQILQIQPLQHHPLHAGLLQFRQLQMDLLPQPHLHAVPAQSK